MRVFVLAGEPSGDRLGGALMEGLRTLRPDVVFEGIGGPAMEAQGLRSRFPMAELSIMGLVEVLPKYFHLKRRIEETAQAVLAMRPDVLITIDSPDFSLRVARRVKAASDIRTVHYVAPSVWAWRPGRADKMAKVIDHVLALLPFEPPYIERAGMECDFVGHPVVGEPEASGAEIAALRDELGLGDAPLLLALPGSRRGEVERLAPVFGAALKRFLPEHPGMRVVVPVVPHVADQVAQHVADWPGAPVLVDPRGLAPEQAATHKRAAFAAADLALAASGTVSLELAAAGTPMVIAYKVNWLTQKIAERMVTIDTVTLVNLVSETRVVPECLGPACTPENIAARLAAVHADPAAQDAAMRLTMERLGRGGPPPGLRAAQAVLDRLTR
ncbi:lipid-A-disaccharide synthase [Ruegeria aquimaris]|uniref:Lipid-A-disaccharide synthase n=1 Tax=Ruegeria aquimaris TaxID=2984333 RepID=A0ABT3AEI9_9RHOB|nr:lipid-A-disaccharide synthase [Ruegeria sp. XHP0148]MCV2886717.1 lipid-A-disaccharide synthase [Ruegeria sp. XHP0148]